ncbi:MAG TPA: hypothetical protein VN442_06960 [Bryobacteraceae bacterium]|nr:hypothetical protein [Bryobacteraceae bacterium]HWR35589.1 hypothetical protein [Clostridia bacterium]
MAVSLLTWLKQNWSVLGNVGSAVLSISAFVLSYRKYKHDTRPVLVLRRAKGGFAIENFGRGIAAGVSVRLIERTRRPSAALYVEDLLKPDSRCLVSAGGYPEELVAEMERNSAYSSFEDVIRSLHGEQLKPTGEHVASYLLTREGKQIVLLRFRTVDGSRASVRLFSPATHDDGFVELVPYNRILCNRTSAFVLEKRYGTNSILAPAFAFPPQSNPAPPA